MPIGLLLLIAGLVVLFVTSFVTLGWILVGIGAGIVVLNVLLFGVALLGAKKIYKSQKKAFADFDKHFDNFPSF